MYLKFKFIFLALPVHYELLVSRMFVKASIIVFVFYFIPFSITFVIKSYFHGTKWISGNTNPVTTLCSRDLNRLHSRWWASSLLVPMHTEVHVPFFFPPFLRSFPSPLRRIHFGQRTTRTNPAPRVAQQMGDGRRSIIQRPQLPVTIVAPQL